MDFINFLIKSNTVNFIIVLLLIIVLVVKINVKSVIEKIRDEITDYVNASTDEKTSANLESEKIKGKIEKLPSLIDRIEKSAEHNVQNMAEKIKSEIIEQKKDIENNAKRLLDLETKKFNSKLINILSEKSVEIARENAISNLKDNRELHNFYIENAINEIDKVNL